MEKKPKPKLAEIQVPFPRLCHWILALTSLAFLYKERLDLKTQKCSYILGEAPHAPTAAPKTGMQGCLALPKQGETARQPEKATELRSPL